jgi:ACT domain-containing protein
MNLQENIRRILREETILPLYIRRRVSMEELDDLVLDVKDLIDSNYDKTDAIYDTVRQFVATKKEFKFKDETEQVYWDSYIEVEEPLVNYVKTNLQESIRRILREETSDDILVIKNILELTVMKDYEDLICDIDVTSIDFYQYKYVLEFTFLRKHEVRTIADYDPYLEIMDEAGNLIYDYTNIDVFVQQAYYVKQCN